MVRHPLNSSLLMGRWYAVIVNGNESYVATFVVINDLEALQLALEGATKVSINGLDSESYCRDAIGNWVLN